MTFSREMFFQDHLALFPKFKIVCETEEHIGFINLRPKEAYQSSAGYAEIDKELFQLTGNRLHCRWAFMILTVPGFFKPVILV